MSVSGIGAAALRLAVVPLAVAIAAGGYLAAEIAEGSASFPAIFPLCHIN